MILKINSVLLFKLCNSKQKEELHLRNLVITDFIPVPEFADQSIGYGECRIPLCYDRIYSKKTISGITMRVRAGDEQRLHKMVLLK